MAKKVFELDDFTGGEYGRLEAWNVKKNMWTGLNMLVYRTGELGVRPGVRNVTPTGVATGAMWGMGANPGDPAGVWYGQGTAIKYFGAYEGGGAVSTATGSLSGTPSRVALDETGSTTYIATTSAGCYSFNGSSITTLTNAPNSYAIAQYGDRMIVVPGSARHTIRFSDAADYTSWPAANAIAVGDPNDFNTALQVQRTHLVILKDHSSHYVLTGVPGVNETLRPVAKAEGPTSHWHANKTRSSDAIWYVSDQWPIMFDGTRVRRVDHISMPLYVDIADLTVAPLTNDDETGFVIVSKGSAANSVSPELWINYRGTWSRHQFGVTISDWVSTGWHGYPQEGSADASKIHYGSKIVLSDGGSASAAPNFWSWQPFMDRPGLEVSPFGNSAERCGDASTSAVTGNVTFPELHTDDGSELRVTGVIVHFRKWNTGSSTNNHFDLSVDTLGSYETAGVVSSATGTFDEAPSLSSLGGTLQSKYFSFGDQGRGRGFQLSFENVRGVAFKRIQIITDVTPPRI